MRSQLFERLRNLPFIRSMVEGGGNDPKRCVVTRIVHSNWTLASCCPAPMAVSGLICTSGETWLSCGIVLLRTPRYESPCTELPGHVLATSRGSRQPRMLVRAPPALCGWRWSMRLFRPYAMLPERSGPCMCACLVVIASRRRCGMTSVVCGRYWWPRWRAKVDGETPL